MTQIENKLNWQDGLKIALAVMTFGVGWMANNQTTVISFAAVLIVWLMALTLKQLKFAPTKATLTMIVFAVAIILSLAFQPVALPPFPTWSGDVSAFTPLLIAFFIAFLQMAAGVVAYATGVYNILLSQVLEKIAGASTALLVSASPGE